MQLLPASATLDARIVLFTRGVRAFVDGIAFVVLPAYLEHLGFSGLQIGTVVSAGLLGSAMLTLGVGVWSHRYSPERLLAFATWIMIVTGVAFGLSRSFWLLTIICVITTMNTSAGDVSPFLPLEQSIASASVDDSDRTAFFARYALVGALIGSIGALCAGVPTWIARSLHHADQTGRQASFVLYGLSGIIVLFAYRRLSHHTRQLSTKADSALTPESRRIVYRLAALFSLDSLGGGFATQAIFALWVFHKFGLSVQTLGSVFFAAGVLGAFSGLLAVRISRRIGLVRTMVFTHIPASVLLILVVFAPNVWLAMGLFIFRGLLSQMDVPARTSYVMAVVSPRERAAAASITNVPRSLASAFPPILAGWILDHTTFGWPLLMCAIAKITYDLLLLRMFKDVRPPEET